MWYIHQDGLNPTTLRIPSILQKTAHFPDHIFLYHSETDLKNNGFSRQINTIVYSKCKK